eukprot:286923-Amphidinium_carterae.1
MSKRPTFEQIGESGLRRAHSQKRDVCHMIVFRRLLRVYEAACNAVEGVSEASAPPALKR